MIGIPHRTWRRTANTIPTELHMRPVAQIATAGHQPNTSVPSVAPMDVVLVSALAEGMVAPVDPGSQPTLLDKIIQSGIKQYFVDQLLPETPDSLKLYYSSEQIAWADEYEAFLYKDVISHLYDIDFVVHRDYLGNKPYSTHISQEAPPRIGQYIGWKIVNAYTKRHPEITLPQLCGMTDYDRIFKEARYRPNP